MLHMHKYMHNHTHGHGHAHTYRRGHTHVHTPALSCVRNTHTITRTNRHPNCKSITFIQKSSSNWKASTCATHHNYKIMIVHNKLYYHTYNVLRNDLVVAPGVYPHRKMEGQLSQRTFRPPEQEKPVEAVDDKYKVK